MRNKRHVFEQKKNRTRAGILFNNKNKIDFIFNINWLTLVI